MTAAEPPRHVRFETTDSDHAAEFLTKTYGTRFRLGKSADGHRFRHLRLISDMFSVDTTSVSTDTEFTVDGSPLLFVCRAKDTVLSRRCAGVEHRVGSNEVLLCNTEADGPGFRTRFDSGSVVTTVIPFELLSEIGASEQASRPTPIRWTGVLARDPAAVRHLNTTVDYVATAMLDQPEVMSQPLVKGPVARMLAAAVLAAFPSTVVTEPTSQDRWDAHPRTLRRAIAFIDGAAYRDITVAEIAAASNVTIRALQHAFRRHLGVTPTGYVRRVRLQQAHRELLSADPATGVTVTDIAARWGFFHPGRFAQYYRDTYGHPPSRTLLRHGC
jgi:AraC-like DNA-binding protein